MRAMCSCGRSEVEPGFDLCRYCRADYEERQMHREQEAAFNAEQQAEHDAWLNAQAPEHQPDGIHTIPVPKGWSVEQAWEAICRGDKLPEDAASWANVRIEDGRFVGLA